AVCMRNSGPAHRYAPARREPLGAGANPGFAAAQPGLRRRRRRRVRLATGGRVLTARRAPFHAPRATRLAAPEARAERPTPRRDGPLSFRNIRKEPALAKAGQ